MSDEVRCLDLEIIRRLRGGWDCAALFSNSLGAGQLLDKKLMVSVRFKRSRRLF